MAGIRGLDSCHQSSSGPFRCKIPESDALVAATGLVDELAESVKTLYHLPSRRRKLVPESRLRKIQHLGRFSIAKLEYLAQKQCCLLCGPERSTNAGKAKRDVFFYFVPEVRLAHDCGQFLNLIWLRVQFLLSDQLCFLAPAFALSQAIKRQVRRDAKPPCL
jgi:hypothetical protein